MYNHSEIEETAMKNKNPTPFQIGIFFIYYYFFL